MAKQLVNPIERHVEKGVLAIAGLLLLGVVAKFVISSPNQVQLGGEVTSPGGVNEKVAQLASSVRQDLLSASATPEIPERLYDEWVDALDPFAAPELETTLPCVARLEPEVPIVDVVGTDWDAELPDPPAFAYVDATYGRSTFIRPDDQGIRRFFPTNWVTVSGVFDVRTMMRNQKESFGAVRKEVVFGRPELQRRAIRPDGSWSDDDWADVTPWFTPDLPVLPRVRLVEEDGKLVCSLDDQADVDRFDDELAHPLLQLDLIRPLLPEIANGDPWDFAILTTRRDVLYQDEFYRYPNDPRSKNPDDRYGGESSVRSEREVELSPEEELAQKFAEIDRLMKEAWKLKDPNMATMAYNMAAQIKEQDRTASAQDKEKATRLKGDAGQLINDIDRWNFKNVRGGGAPKPVATKEVEAPAREPEDNQQIWVHDAVPGSVEGGKTYQYRVRVVVFNRLAGRPERFRDPQDATVFWIHGPWSDPVEVYIEPTSVMFAASKDTRRDQVAIEIYQWFEGVWVKDRPKFGVGDAVREQTRKPVPSLMQPGKVDHALIDFDPGVSVLDIDFERPYRERKRGTSREGVKFGPPTTACSVVFADAEGRLSERFVPTDKGHPAKRTYANREFKEPRD
ncbi:MAG: hypothetical protein PVI86_12580 [Phycisphaerae bacterium]|jgi:hypothetical protein